MSATFDSWAILELFGHRQLAGRVREIEMFGAKMCRVDVPALPEEIERDYWGKERTTPAVPAFTQYYGGSSIFSLTPTTEALALAAAKRMRQRPAHVMDVPAERMIEAAASNEPDAFPIEEAGGSPPADGTASPESQGNAAPVGGAGAQASERSENRVETYDYPGPVCARRICGHPKQWHERHGAQHFCCEPGSSGELVRVACECTGFLQGPPPDLQEPLW